MRLVDLGSQRSSFEIVIDILMVIEKGIPLFSDTQEPVTENRIAGSCILNHRQIKRYTNFILQNSLAVKRDGHYFITPEGRKVIETAILLKKQLEGNTGIVELFARTS